MAASNSTTYPYTHHAYPSTSSSQYTVGAGNTNTGSVYLNDSATTRGVWDQKAGMVDSTTTEAELKKDVFNVPVNRLIDLWIARFGNEWANLEDIDNDEFFSLAYKRLKQLGELEVHYLTDRARYVCRVPE